MKYLVFILFTILSININATTYCIQEFNMIGLDTSKVVTLYITETISGECNLVKLHKIIINDSTADYKEIRYDVEETLEQTCKIVDNRMINRIGSKREIPNILFIEDSLWKSKESDISIKKSKYTLIFQEKIKKEQLPVGYSWNRKYGNEGIVSPDFINSKTILLYYHPAGLYVDYTIDKIYYFKNAGYLLVFTHQSRSGPGMDSMHGYLLYKLK